MRRLVLGIVLGGAACGGGTESPPIATSVRNVAPPATAKDAGAPPATTRREDLTRLDRPLPATITVPIAATVAASSRAMADADGFTYASPIARISGLPADLELSMMDPYSAMPTSLAQALTANQTRSSPFTVVATQEAATGAWGVALAWGDGTCHVSGALGPAKVWCASAELKVPCEAARALVDACASLEPTGPAFVPTPDVAATFHDVTDAKALEVLAAAARAVVHGDRDAIVALVGPRGIDLKGKRLTRDGLRALLRHDTVQRAFEIDCRQIPGVDDPGCVWSNSTPSDTGADGTLAIVSSRASYGVVPRMSFTRDKAGAWWLSGVDFEDLGGDP